MPRYLAACLFVCAMWVTSHAQMANVVVYRPRELYNMRKASIVVDGQKICRLKIARYHRFQLPAGNHSITGPDKRQILNLDLLADHSYYFRVENTPGFRKVLLPRNLFILQPVAVDTGEMEITTLKAND